jgi:hypothetical protein
VVVGSPSTQEETPDGFRPLFNGKDLSGWKIDTGFPGDASWRIVNGILSAHDPDGKFVRMLHTVRDDYKDFHLKVEARLLRRPDPGDGIHTRVGREGGWLFDAEEIVNELGSKVLGEWVKIELIVAGYESKHVINGRQVKVVSDQFKIRGLSGRISFWSRGPTMEYRRVEIKEFAPIVEETVHLDGKWTDQDQKYGEQQTYYKAFPIKLKAGRNYSIALMRKPVVLGGKTDVQLFLEDSDTKVVRQEGAPKFLARFDIAPQKDGDYRIIATTMVPATGDFTLLVREEKERTQK